MKPAWSSEWESRSAASTADALSNGDISQDSFGHVEYGRHPDDRDPWWTDLSEATLQELFETILRESMEICAASKARSASSHSVEDVGDAMKRLSMRVPLRAPIVQMPNPGGPAAYS